MNRAEQAVLGAIEAGKALDQASLEIGLSRSRQHGVTIVRGAQGGLRLEWRACGFLGACFQVCWLGMAGLNAMAAARGLIAGKLTDAWFPALWSAIVGIPALLALFGRTRIDLVHGDLSMTDFPGSRTTLVQGVREFSLVREPGEESDSDVLYADSQVLHAFGTSGRDAFISALVLAELKRAVAPERAWG
jgi:hypothetical protein